VRHIPYSAVERRLVAWGIEASPWGEEFGALIEALDARYCEFWAEHMRKALKKGKPSDDDDEDGRELRAFLAQQPKP
jgi:hypothetical protein